MTDELKNTGAASGLSAAPGYAWESPADDVFTEILDGAWAVICTADGWELESQHSAQTFPLKSTDEESAIVKGEKLAKEIEGRFSHTSEHRHADHEDSN